MKTSILLLTLIAFSVSAIFAQNVSVTDYDVPVSSAKTLRLNGNFNWSQTSQEDSSGVKQTDVTSNKANLNLIFRTFYSSLPFAWFLDIDANGGKDYSDFTHDIKIAPRIRKYIWDDQNLFGFAAMNIQHANTYKQISSDLSVGGGWGRYINATELAKAVRIEEHLIADKILNGHMPKQTLINMAHIIEKEPEYKDKYGARYERQWYEDIAKEIEKSGQLVSDKLGAMGILRIQQVLQSINERVNDRYYGWDVNAGVLFDLTTFDKSDPNEPALTLGGRWSYPVTWRTQINAYANVNSPFNQFFKYIGLNAGADYIYEVGNLINLVGSYRLNMTKPEEGDSWMDHTLTATFLFYLENNIYLGINLNVISFGNPALTHGIDYRPQTDLGTSITLQYNLF